MEALAILVVIVLFTVLAIRFGHDSRPHLRSEEEVLADKGFLIDDGHAEVARPRALSSSRSQHVHFLPGRDRKVA